MRYSLERLVSWATFMEISTDDSMTCYVICYVMLLYYIIVLFKFSVVQSISISTCKFHNNKCSSSKILYSLFRPIFTSGLSYWNCKLVADSKGRKFSQNFTKIPKTDSSHRISPKYTLRVKAADRWMDCPVLSRITVLGTNNMQRGNMLTTLGDVWSKSLQPLQLYHQINVRS